MLDESQRRMWVCVSLLVAVGLLGACGEIGSGDIVTEDRPVGAFDRLEISGGVNVEVVVDEAASPSVSVTYDDNLLDNVITRVDGDTLVIRFEGNITSIVGSGRRVNVTVGSLTRIDASGGSDLEASGSTDSYRLDASGGADVDLSQLLAREAEVDISGGADVQVFATDTVEGSISGGADLTVKGRPARVAVDTSGGADLLIEE